LQQSNEFNNLKKVIKCSHDTFKIVLTHFTPIGNELFIPFQKTEKLKP